MFTLQFVSRSISAGNQWSCPWIGASIWSAGIIPPENFAPSPDAERFGVLSTAFVPNSNIEAL